MKKILSITTSLAIPTLMISNVASCSLLNFDYVPTRPAE
ncbi:hypothetical protein SCLAR_v1c13260 [Spiroplasma clarkii]|uniref:Uncharacterized protein n=1 Tax=Spiroplasma clarkii TaxID=2139 RepID=A0A2K8KP36_9MOLU|nr:hypothetical protein SCLAR_v1c13260 [Spiroplasma clarkii]